MFNIEVLLDADLSYQECTLDASCDEQYEIASCIERQVYDGATSAAPSLPSAT